jgi:hypothetical protein
MSIPGVGGLEIRGAPETAAGAGVGPETPTAAMGEPSTSGGRDAKSGAPHWVQKRVSSAFGWEQAGHGFIQAPGV